MAPDSARLRRLAAEIRAESDRLDRTASEVEQAAAVLRDRSAETLIVYGLAALLETFYSGVEKALVRVARAHEGLPDGTAWHRALLEQSTVEVPKLRAPVLSSQAGRALEPYLSFRHRFRNLYLFDLDATQLAPLVQALPAAWQLARGDLRQFAQVLEDQADALDEPAP